MATDPVCTMKVDEETTEFTSEYDGEIYYFCSNACKEEFESDPERYVGSIATRPPAVFCVFAGVLTPTILQ